jgi:ABC-2 type transport system ATP-binding protein
MIEVENLTKRYGRATAVDRVSFKVEKGEILGFLGPNGAGKTTTMRILTCYLPATEGTAKVAGYDVFEAPLEVKKRVGYIPETPPLYPDMEVETFLDFCAKIKGVLKKDRKGKIADAMEKTRVADVRGKLIGRLSKGYRQRVGLAQAILNNPDVLILDEPTAGLDPKQIIETRELIKALGGEHTIVLSTHILPEVSMTCGRVLIINKGRVVAEDTPGNLTHRLRGAGALRVEVKGDAASAAEVLRAVPGVVSVRPKAEPAVGAVFEVEAESGRDVRAELAAAVVQKGLGLLGLEQVGMSLEDIFLQLTTSDTAVGDTGAAPAPPPAPETASTEVSA